MNKTKHVLEQHDGQHSTQDGAITVELKSSEIMHDDAESYCAENADVQYAEVGDIVAARPHSLDPVVRVLDARKHLLDELDGIAFLGYGR